MTTPKRGDFSLVNFDPTLGAEIRKTRPALILQNDIANRHSPITIVAANPPKFEDGGRPQRRLDRAAQSDSLD